MATPGGDAPSGTTLRLALVVALASTATLFVYSQVGAVWQVTTLNPNARCQVRAGLYLTSTGILGEGEDRWSAYHRCLGTAMLPKLGWSVAGLILLALVASALYVAMPRWRVRRSRLRELRHIPALDERLRAPLADLVATAGLRRSPRFLIDPASPRAGGLAFGTGRRTRVCLDAGLVALRDRDRAAFDAVVLHELAHVRNNDVPATYLTIAVWRAFLIVGLVPYMVSWLDPYLLSPDPWRPPPVPEFDFLLVGLVVRALAMVAVVFLARSAVLRSRERYADAAAAAWTGRPDPYRSLATATGASRFRRWATHPGPAARRAAMRRPHLLLKPGVGEYVASGLVLELAWSTLVDALSEIDWYRYGNASHHIMNAVWGTAVGILIGTIAWRGAACSDAFPRRRGLFAAPGAGLAVGIALGQALELRQTMPWLRQLVSPVSLTFHALLLAGCVLTCVWAGRCAGLAGTRIRSRRGLLVGAGIIAVSITGPAMIHFAAISSQAWTMVVEPALALMDTTVRSAGRPAVDGPIAKSLLVLFLYNYPRVATGAGLVAIWLVPLLLTPGSGRRWRTTVLGAAAGAAGWAAAVVALRLAAGHRDTPAFHTVMAARELAAAVVVQVVVAVVVARRSGRLTAAVTTWVLGLLVCAAMWAIHVRHGQSDSVLAASPLQSLTLTGALAVLLSVPVRRRAVPRPAERARGGVATRARRSWGLAAAALLLAASAGGLVHRPHAPAAVELVTAAAPATYDPDDATLTWFLGGGLDHLLRLQNRRMLDPTTACGQLRAAVRESRQFPPPPVDPARGHWSALLDAWTPIVSGCRPATADYHAVDLETSRLIAEMNRLLDSLNER
ncbi:M48 family metalloprotease [Actinoplanes sp. NPDC049265]|uniref:M48 family metalloprotease n=1 Tax=Actinoplanes sp. NPDC049265 TaxID=3363902 RepID=UPI00371C62A7